MKVRYTHINLTWDTEVLALFLPCRCLSEIFRCTASTCRMQRQALVDRYVGLRCLVLFSEYLHRVFAAGIRYGNGIEFIHDAFESAFVT